MIAKITSGSGFGGVLDYLTEQKRGAKEKGKIVEHKPEKTLERDAPSQQMDALEKNKSANLRDQIGAETKVEKATGKREQGALDTKPEEGRGERHRIIGGNMTGRTARELAREFEVFREQRPEIKKPVHHVSLSLARGEQLTIAQWNEIAEKYVRKMNFGSSPFVVVQHVDTEHDHVHIVASRIDARGKVISDFQSKRRAEEFVRAIEREYNLVQVKRSRDTKRAAPKRGEIERFNRTGELSAKMRLQAHVDYALKERATAAEFVERLNRVGVELIPYFQTAEKVSGVSFRLGRELMKGSNLGGAYSWTGLQKRGLLYDQTRDLAALREAQGRALQEPNGGQRVAAPEMTRSDVPKAQQPEKELSAQILERTEQSRETQSKSWIHAQLGRESASNDYPANGQMREQETIERLQQVAGIESRRDGQETVERLQKAAGLECIEGSLASQRNAPDRVEIPIQERTVAPLVPPAAERTTIAAKEARERVPEKSFELTR